MTRAGHALRASLALELWAIEPKSQIMALGANEGLALFCGLNAMPKKSFLSEYSSRITPQKGSRLLALWHAQLGGARLLAGQSLNLDFHCVPYFGEHPLIEMIESHYLSKRSRRQPSVLTLLAQDADSQVFCYSNADIRKSEEAFVDFWKPQYGKLPQHLVFDSKRTTYHASSRSSRQHHLPDLAPSLAQLARRSCGPAGIGPAYRHPGSAHRRYRNPQVDERKVPPRQRTYRQFLTISMRQSAALGSAMTGGSVADFARFLDQDNCTRRGGADENARAGRSTDPGAMP